MFSTHLDGAERERQIDKHIIQNDSYSNPGKIDSNPSITFLKITWMKITPKQ